MLSRQPFSQSELVRQENAGRSFLYRKLFGTLCTYVGIVVNNSSNNSHSSGISDVGSIGGNLATKK